MTRRGYGYDDIAQVLRREKWRQTFRPSGEGEVMAMAHYDETSGLTITHVTPPSTASNKDDAQIPEEKKQ
jgi:hypothetical protein